MAQNAPRRGPRAAAKAERHARPGHRAYQGRPTRALHSSRRGAPFPAGFGRPGRGAAPAPAPRSRSRSPPTAASRPPPRRPPPPPRPCRAAPATAARGSDPPPEVPNGTVEAPSARECAERHRIGNKRDSCACREGSIDPLVTHTVTSGLRAPGDCREWRKTHLAAGRGRPRKPNGTLAPDTAPTRAPDQGAPFESPRCPTPGRLWPPTPFPPPRAAAYLWAPRRSGRDVRSDRDHLTATT